MNIKTLNINLEVSLLHIQLIKSRINNIDIWVGTMTLSTLLFYQRKSGLYKREIVHFNSVDNYLLTH